MSHVQASAYKKQLCIYGFVFFFLLTKLILTLSRHIVWNPGLSLFPHEHPITVQRIHTVQGFPSASGSLVVRTTAEHICIYAVKAFGSEDFNGSTSFSVIAGMRSISLPSITINTQPISPQTRPDSDQIAVVFLLYYQLLNHSDLTMG